ncbi:MAG: EAL domain-containing protein [Campylobacteraceae bacterium]|nr:EAL domain-containing protein [Campylobacteraceae bacterium]
MKNIRYKNATKTLFLIDILYMKDLNAIYGFKNGDLIIKQLGLLLKNLLKNEISLLLENKLNRKISYEFKRKHADVFSLIFFEDLDTSILMKIKNLILAKLQTFQFNTKNPIAKINIDVTIGCSKSNNDKIVVYAEKALKNAKLNFESYMYFDSNLYINEALTQNLVEIIKYNIDKKSVEPYFQAIYDNTNDCIYKYEALMRLFDKNGNILLPNAFLEKAKQCRLYNRLMQILINKVFDIIIKHSIHVSINLEYNDIINPLIKNTIIDRLQESDIGRYLTIEILESQKIHNFDTVNDFIQKIKVYHVKIAIDDFGTGFSNYDYILKLNVDYIKIDGSLIEKIDEEIYSNLIKSIVGFCKKQDIKLIAEFVYDIKKFRYVKSLDIEYSQGYYIQKPLPFKTILEK